MFAAVGWLCLFSYLLVVGHYLIVEHETCAAHGELIHVGTGHGKAHDASHASEAPKTPVEHVSPRSDADHEHDHCWVSTDRREAPPSPIHYVPHCLSSETLDATALVHPSFVRARPIYAYAPKTSPPQKLC